MPCKLLGARSAVLPLRTDTPGPYAGSAREHTRPLLTRRPPCNVDLNEYDLSSPHSPLPQPRPLSEPTTATFLILRRQLSAIIGRIVHHFQKLNEPAQYGDVQRLQEELDQFTQNLPPHFRMKDADKSLDKRE